LNNPFQAGAPDRAPVCQISLFDTFSGEAVEKIRILGVFFTNRLKHFHVSTDVIRKLSLYLQEKADTFPCGGFAEPKILCTFAEHKDDFPLRW